MSHVGVDNVYSLDLSSNGRVLLNTVVAGLVVAPDIATKTKLWSKQLGGLVHTLRIVGNVVVGPAYDCPVSVLDVVTGDTTRQWPADWLHSTVLVGELALDLFVAAPQHKIAI